MTGNEQALSIIFTAILSVGALCGIACVGLVVYNLIFGAPYKTTGIDMTYDEV